MEANKRITAILAPNMELRRYWRVIFPIRVIGFLQRPRMWDLWSQGPNLSAGRYNNHGNGRWWLATVYIRSRSFIVPPPLVFHQIDQEMCSMHSFALLALISTSDVLARSHILDDERNEKIPPVQTDQCTFCLPLHPRTRISRILKSIGKSNLILEASWLTYLQRHRGKPCQAP